MGLKRRTFGCVYGVTLPSYVATAAFDRNCISVAFISQSTKNLDVLKREYSCK